eukprot:gene11473-13375_t
MSNVLSCKGFGLNTAVAGHHNIFAAMSSVFAIVPAKNYPTGDGVAFAWVMSVGTLCVAYVAMFVSGDYIFDPWGLLGGSLWSIGNYCVIPIVKTIGLGLGLLLWSCTSLIVGFFLGKFGWFGVDKHALDHPILNWIGFGSIVVAMCIFFFIKPTIEKDEKRGSVYEYSAIVDDPIAINYKSPSVSDENEKLIFEKIPPPFNTLFGIALAVFSGILYGVNMVPMTLWTQDQKNAGHDPSPLAFIFCHFSGIFLFNTVVFMLYALIKRPPQLFPQTVFPSFISGLLWGIANVGLMVATQKLGYTVGFPMGSSGPMIVSSLWSVLLFKEIRGVRNIIILLVSFAFLGAGIVMLPLSSASS